MHKIEFDNLSDKDKALVSNYYQTYMLSIEPIPYNSVQEFYDDNWNDGFDKIIGGAEHEVIDEN